MPDYCVYVMTNRSGTLYIGVTNDLVRRVREHQLGTHEGFTKRYRMTRLLYIEQTPDVRDAIQREKHLKGWTRKRKLELIEAQNPQGRDLSEGWYEEKLESSAAEGQMLRSAQHDIDIKGTNLCLT